MSTTIQNIHLQSSPLSDQYLSASYSTSEQIKQYVSAMIDTIEIPVIPEINLSNYAQLSDIPNLSNVAKLNEENTFTENNTFTDISTNTVDTRNLLLGDSNEKYGDFVFASGENNKVGAKGFYYGAIELPNVNHSDTIHIYLKKDQPEYDKRCRSEENKNSTDRKNKAISHEYSSPLISSDVSNTAISTLIKKDTDVFNYMKNNYSDNNALSGILLNVVNSSKRAFRRITIDKFATINNEIRYDVLECKVDTMHKLFDGSDIIETIFSTIPYDYDDYSVVFCGHPEIGLNMNVSKNAAAIGTENTSMGRETISLGRLNYVEGNYATAIGRGNKVYGYIGFASGVNCQAGISSDVGSMHAEGNQTSALASGSHTEGYRTVVYPGCSYSHAEGYMTITEGQASHASGCHVVAKENNTFAWSGVKINDTAPISNYYQSNGEGTFNINPKDGLSGFYIGDDNFIKCVLNAISSMNVTQKGQLKEILGIS